MLARIGAGTLDELVAETLPPTILDDSPMGFGAGLTEHEALQRIRRVADRNKVLTSLIGPGYHGTILPPVIQRNLLENPAW